MWVSLVFAALVTAGPLQPAGFGPPGSRGPAVYRLEGYLDKAPAGQTVYYSVVLGFGPQERTYLITKYARQGDGDPFLMFRNLGMFKPDFIFIGEAKPIEALLTAEPGSRVSGRFYYRAGMHVLEMDPQALEIEPPPAATPAA